jgi:class 3 adenylate cyclase
MNVRLVSRNVESPGEEHPLDGDVTTVGRDKSNDIVLASPGVSRYHARIVRRGGSFSVEDLGSSNGTWLNDVRVDGSAVLNSGDDVRFDQDAFAFQNDYAASRTMARQPQNAHETVTVMFADLVGHTALFDSLGAEAVYRVIDERMSIMKTEVSRAGGRVVKTEGDAVMASFSSIRQAVTCAVEIQRAVDALSNGEAPIAPVRIGINSGEALKQGDDLIGIAVIKAARVMSAAGAGEIYLSEVARTMLGPTTALSIKPKGWYQLKGITRRERLFEVAWK